MAPKLQDDTVLSFKQENPRRPGCKAHERYERYKSATTVLQAIQLGALRQDLSNDVKQGYCTVTEGLANVVPKVQELEAIAPSSGLKRLAAEAGLGAPPAKRVDLLPVVEIDAVRSTPAEVVKAPSPVLSGGAVSSSSVPKEEVDLSFAKLDGKPLKFIKRAMGEARRLLCAHGLEEAQKAGYEFKLIDRDNLSKWGVKLRDLNPDGELTKGLRRHGLEPSIDLELILPDNFPMEPPFARVVYPQLAGGYVFSRGGICFEALTAKGWAPSMTLPALVIAIKGILDYGEVKVAGVGNKQTRTVPHYTEEGARQDHQHIVSAHRGGEGSTYGSLKHYAS